MQSVPYSDISKRYSTYVLEYLDRLTASNPKAVGEIFLRMLEKTVPIYNEEHIVSIVKKLYESGNKTAANDICDKYGRAGLDFLRQLFDQNNL